MQSSRYAEMFGVPVQAAVALTAFAFSSYLVYVQPHVIGAVCEWCLASDVLTTGVTGLVLLQRRTDVDAA